MTEYEQLKNYAVCNRCGAVLPTQEARDDGWLVAPYRRDPSINVVRCYRHISKRALEWSYAGLTDYWLDKMKEGRERARTEPWRSPLLDPFPLSDELPKPREKK